MANKKSKRSLWDAKIVRRASWDSLLKLHPVTMMRNPVMFVVEVGSVTRAAELLRLDLVAPEMAAFDLDIAGREQDPPTFYADGGGIVPGAEGGGGMPGRQAQLRRLRPGLWHGHDLLQRAVPGHPERRRELRRLCEQLL